MSTRRWPTTSTTAPRSTSRWRRGQRSRNRFGSADRTRLVQKSAEREQTKDGIKSEKLSYSGGVSGRRRADLDGGGRPAPERHPRGSVRATAHAHQTAAGRVKVGDDSVADQ